MLRFHSFGLGAGARLHFCVLAPILSGVFGANIGGTPVMLLVLLFGGALNFYAMVRELAQPA
ncbi:hypothetical protein [Rhodocyclus tenuis]|uniref:Uncharacterized protein n=1 Tax=Rhodocyclus tenuis TaxID=1066 RepID=A0A840G4A8_RHOTE|nr:hypothetical protein [Rhodocyclus tenuis]MBB4246161.1 hypothetical protein [Rhodocyclus tenuis]